MELKFWEKIPLLLSCVMGHVSCFTCYVSHVMAHMSGVICQVSTVICHMSHVSIFNRPGVAGVVLQTPLSLIHWLSEWAFSSKPSNHHYTQTIRARKLKLWDNVHLPPCVICHVSNVLCHVSGVRCHMSGVTCQVSNVKKKNLDKVVKLVWWRVCYQRGLPRPVLVSIYFLSLSLVNGETIQWRVCYQWGLPHLVYYLIGITIKVTTVTHSKSFHFSISFNFFRFSIIILAIEQ